MSSSGPSKQEAISEQRESEVAEAASSAALVVMDGNKDGNQQQEEMRSTIMTLREQLRIVTEAQAASQQTIGEYKDMLAEMAKQKELQQNEIATIREMVQNLQSGSSTAGSFQKI
mmetsp:Transcript_93126/g.203877  ORF Transcript_93126/g.203877 Transcript_93126/m.203877 type:complete len:115 (-) Transcript_93126:130-474(-)